MADFSEVIKIQYDTDEAVNKINELSKAIENNKARQIELKEQLKKGQISQQDYAIQMAESTQTLNRDSFERKKYINVLQAEVGSVKRAKAENQVLREERNKLSAATVDGRKKIEEYNKKIDANTTVIKGNVDSQSKWYMGVKSGITQFAKIGLAIGAGAVALMKFGKQVINSSDVMQDKFEVAMASAKGATSAFFRTIAAGDWKNLIDNMITGAKAAKEFAIAMDELNDRALALTIMESQLNKYQQEQLKILRNVLLTDKERIQAAENIVNEEKKVAEVRKDIAKKMLDAKLKEHLANKKVSEAIIEDNLVNIEQNIDLIQNADKYNDAIEKKKEVLNINSKFARMKYGEEVDAIKEITETDNEKLKTFAANREKFRGLNEEERKELAKLYIEYNNAIASYDENTQRSETQKNALIEQYMRKQEEDNKKGKKTKEDLDKEETENKKNQLLAQLQAIEDAAQKEINIEKNKVLTNQQTEEQLTKKVLEIKIKSSQDQLLIDGLNNEQRLEIETGLMDDLLILNKLNNKEIEKEDEAFVDDMLIRRGAAIAKLAELRQQEFEAEAKTYEDKRLMQILNSEAELENVRTQKDVLNEEIELAEAEHNARLIEIEVEYQENIRQQREAALDEVYYSMQEIIAATENMGNRRLTIVSDTFSRIATINFKEVKSAKSAFLAIGSAAQGLTNLITASHQAELNDLEMQKNAELEIAGNNIAAREDVERKFNKKLVELKKAQYKDEKNKAIIDAAIATALGVVRALGSSGPPLNFIMAALVGILGGVQIGVIASQKEPTFTSDQIFAKGGAIGGKDHAHGGTKFYGTDGSMFEAEKGEAMFVMKKDATAEIAALSMINESHGGRSWGKGASHLAEGGEASGVEISKMINEEIQRTPIFVTIGDIETGITDYNNVKKAGVI